MIKKKLWMIKKCFKFITRTYYNARLWEQSGKGFEWSMQEIELSEIMPEPLKIEAGVGYIDDSLPMAGGGPSKLKRKSIEQNN